MTHYDFEVAMTCEGCSGAVKRILERNKDKGIANFEIDLEKKTVSVESSTLSAEEVEAMVAKCGKDVKFIGSR